MVLYKKVMECIPGQVEVVRNRLIRLYPGRASDAMLEKYYKEKFKLTGIVLLVGGVLGCCLLLADRMNLSLEDNGRIRRLEDEREVILMAEVRVEDKVCREEFRLEIEPQSLTEESAEKILNELIDKLDECVKGENESLQRVNKNLYFPEEVEGYPFLIQWKSGNKLFVKNDGTISTDMLEEPVVVPIKAEFFYDDYIWEHSWEVVVCLPERGEEEQIFHLLRKEIGQKEEAQRYDADLILPAEVDGVEIVWKEKSTYRGFCVMGLALLAGILIFCAKDKDLEKQLEDRRQEIRKEYASLVSRYALLIEAGLTVRRAFFKIYDDSCRQEFLSNHPLYEEMRYSCNEMRAGISESKVLEDFSRRIDVPEYAKFSGLLVQNLKKGNTALVKRLKEERENALEKELQRRKRQGEEASTKLLFPMCMILLMILMMLMLPAFTGLGI